MHHMIIAMTPRFSDFNSVFFRLQTDSTILAKTFSERMAILNGNTNRNYHQTGDPQMITLWLLSIMSGEQLQRDQLWVTDDGVERRLNI